MASMGISNQIAQHLSDFPVVTLDRSVRSQLLLNLDAGVYEAP